MNCARLFQLMQLKKFINRGHDFETMVERLPRVRSVGGSNPVSGQANVWHEEEFFKHSFVWITQNPSIRVILAAFRFLNTVKIHKC